MVAATISAVLVAATFVSGFYLWGVGKFTYKKVAGTKMANLVAGTGEDMEAFMTDKETELTKKYLEAPLIVAMAESTWAGSRKAAKVEITR